MASSPVDWLLGQRLDFLLAWWCLGQLSMDCVRDLLVQKHDTNEMVLREAADYYARNSHGYESEWLIPAMTFALAVSCWTALLRAWYRRRFDDYVILAIAAAGGLAVQIWLHPLARALSAGPAALRGELLTTIGKVHFAQLAGTVVVIVLHWRASLAGSVVRTTSHKDDDHCKESPVDSTLGVRLDFLLAWLVLGLLCVDMVRDKLVHQQPTSRNVVREAMEYYARNGNSYIFDYLIPAVSVASAVPIVTRAWCRRGVDDFLILGLSCVMGLSTQIWLEPLERGISTCKEGVCGEQLATIGRVHFAQLVGTLAMTALHWRALAASSTDDAHKSK